MLYEAYHSNATINITGPGRKNIKIIIWATYQDQLFFSSNLVHKQISYAGYNRAAVNKVAKSEFGEEANVIFSSYESPVDISVFYYGKYYFSKTAIFSSFNILQLDHIFSEKHIF